MSQFIDLSASDWALAALLGEARRQSNDKIRKSSRDRGVKNNVHVDLMGSLSELAVLKHLWPDLTSDERADVLAGMFRPEGGGGKHGVDLTLSKRELRLDVKTFDCADNKRFFAINHLKHLDLRTICDGYICVICPKYAKRAYLVDYVQYSEVSQWDLKALGTYGDKSHNIPIDLFMRRYTEISLAEIKNTALLSRQEIHQEINSSKIRDKFESLWPQAVSFVAPLPSRSPPFPVV